MKLYALLLEIDIFVHNMTCEELEDNDNSDNQAYK